jgi:beta-glucanase (GH16 family)
MKQGCIALLVAALSALDGSAAAGAPDVVAGGYLSPDRYPGMELVWREEFNGSALDEGRWERTAGEGEGSELQEYDPENVRLADGYLRIVADKPAQAGGRFVSGRIVSRSPQQFSSHRIDVRLSLPEGQGLRSHVSLQDVQGHGLDIVEMVGGDGRENSVHGTVRFSTGRQSRFESGSMTLPGDTFTGQFHVFSVVWDAAQIRWLADGSEFFRYAFPTDAPGLSGQAMQLELSLTVGGDRAGDPGESTGFPRQLVVDYIRVFQQSP